MVTVKICGIHRDEDIEYLNQVLPDYAGFIFDSSAQHYVDPKRAAILRKMLDDRVKTIGVFANAGLLSVVDIANQDIINGVQLHGNESEDYVKKLKRHLKSIPLIQAIRINGAADVAKANASAADFVLIDNGKACRIEKMPWDLISQIKRPIILGGGLEPETVEEAIMKAHPAGVDVCSGVETNGLKDVKKMREFTEKARNC